MHDGEMIKIHFYQQATILIGIEMKPINYNAIAKDPMYGFSLISRCFGSSSSADAAHVCCNHFMMEM